MAEALRVDRQELLHHRPRLCRGLHADILLAGRGQPGAIRLFQLVRNPGRAGAADDTAVRYNDSDDWPAHPPVVCTSSMALWTSSCGNGFFVSRRLHAGRSPGKSILNGNSTGPIPATMAWKANIISLGGKINKTSKKTALLNLSFSRAVLLVLLGFFS